jgi:hypothetical protein
VQYVPPFSIIRNFLNLTNFRGTLTATAPFDEIRRMIRTLLLGMEFDESWYLARNPDIADAVQAGTFKSGKEHFLSDGYFEGRQPCPIVVDAAWYLAQYPEVAEAIEAGRMTSAQQHFDEHGYREGRLPCSL